MTRRRDPRTYISLTDGYVDSPKIARVGGDAGWLDICAISYCARNTTDGLFPKSVVVRLSDRSGPLALATSLVAVGRWHEIDHDCEDCPQPGDDEYVIHDYLEHQRSRQQIEADREQRKAAGQAGGKAKAAYRNVSEPLAVRYESGSGPLEQTSSGPLSGLASGPLADTDTDTEEDQNRSSPPAPDELPDEIADITAARKAAIAQDLADFDAFWAAYPRKQNKTAARKAWPKARKKLSAEDLIKASGLYRDRVRGKELDYIKTPGPWLNEERWTNELNDETQDRPTPPPERGRSQYRYPGDVPTWDM